jgi:hypothetical protein
MKVPLPGSSHGGDSTSGIRGYAVMRFNHLQKLGNKIRASADKDPQSAAVLEMQNGDKYEIHEVATIGRAPDCQVIVNERSISRRHASIFLESGRYWIKDLDSTNGIMVNGKKITFQMLGNNDKIAFGKTKAVFHASGGSAGPVLVGNNSLKELDFLSQDGTPTGGLTAAAGATIGGMGDPKSDNESVVPARKYSAEREGDGGFFPDSSTPASSDTLERENEQLRKLVKQLERALADSNLRLRNLQELLDHKKDKQ